MGDESELRGAGVIVLSSEIPSRWGQAASRDALVARRTGRSSGLGRRGTAHACAGRSLEWRHRS
jgi:hypothetical protein